MDISIDLREGIDTATALSEPRYLQHVVTFNIPRIEWKLENDVNFDLEEHIVHELCHFYTWRIWKLSEQLLGGKDMQHAWNWVLDELFEEATTRIACGMLNVRRAGLEEAETG